MMPRTPHATDDVQDITVLNVNDSLSARYVISKMLRNAGFQVLEAASGKEALALALEHRPAVMLLDVNLPDINGMEVCRRLKQDPRMDSISVVHTSAIFRAVDVKIQGLDLGADGYLMQPFTAQELVATVNSIVRIRRTEKEQRRRADELAEADRKKDDFLAMLAHELRNPLAAIVSSQAVLANFEARTPAEARALEVGRRQAHHLTRIVDDLLDVSRVTRGKIALRKEPVPLLHLLEHVAALSQASVTGPRRQKLTVVSEEKSLHVEGDQTRLEQVFTNLVDNASKYTDAEGDIRISVTRECVQGREWGVVKVKDTGMGVAPESLPHLFGLFFQAHETIARGAGGLGMGLTLVRTLVELHDGTVDVRSDGHNRGSEFEVRLPLLPQEAHPSAPDSAVRLGHVERSPQGRRVLIVEDNADARMGLEDLCELWGHTVATAPDGIEGLKMAVEWQPDVALVDVGLPGLDGFDVASGVRADPRGQGIQLIALTGYGSPEHQARALKAGFDMHLTKPADPETLFKLLSQGRSRGP